MNRAGIRVLQVVTGVLVVTYVVSTVMRPHNTSSPFFDGWVGNLGYAGCAALCASRAIAVRAHRLAWAMIALSLGLFTVGAVLWTTMVQYLNPVPSPSISDACFLIFYPVAYLGVGLLIRSTLPRISRAIWLDGLIAALGVSALEACFVIASISRSTHGGAVTVAINLAYPIGDLVLVAMVVAVFAMRAWRPGRPWWILGAGLVIFAVADSVYVLRVTAGTYVTGTPLDSMWLVGTFLIGIAAWQKHNVPRHQDDQLARVVIPGLFLLSSLAIIVYGTRHHVLGLAVDLATGTLLTAIARMALAYRQLRTLAVSRREARTDELTGLANRRHFGEALDTSLRTRPTDAPLAVLIIDLDGFKEINDTLGHHVGDEVLRRLGPRLVEVVGHEGLVARLGGDEFGLLLAPIVSCAAVTDLADRLRNALRRPVEIDGLSLRIDASIGIALAPTDGTDGETLLQKADVAMYHAKRTRQPWQLYAPDRDIHSRARLELLGSLRDAISRHELVPHYQPKFDVATASMIGVEALVRWEHPTKGLLAPGEFLGLVEQSGLMDALTITILDAALRQQAAWTRSGIDLSMAVNLSAANLHDESLPEKVAAALDRHGVSPTRLILEITEDFLMGDADQSRRVLDRLCALGVDLAIDDYGTGFSSLSYLRDLPVTELKLDRSFLVDVNRDPRAVAIVRSTFELARALGLRTVAEGIETGEALTLVTSLGADIVQGYLLGRPVPASELFTSRLRVDDAARPETDLLRSMR